MSSKYILSVHDGIILRVEWRGDATGPSLRLLVETPNVVGDDNAALRFVEAWRADCFPERPHQHLFVDGQDIVSPLRGSDLIAAAVGSLVQNFQHIVNRVGGEPTPDLEEGQLKTLERWLREAKRAEVKQPA